MSGQHHYRPEHYQPVTAPDQVDVEDTTGPPFMTEPISIAGEHAPHSGMASTRSGQHQHRPEHYQPVTVPDQVDIIDTTGPTFMTEPLSGQHSLPESTKTMTDDHPEHHHRPLPVKTQKPGTISETPLLSSEAASEENTMPPVMNEDKAMMVSEELTNAPESNEAMIEGMSEHDEIISVHEFKEVLHDLVKDAIDKIVMKKVGIVGKLKTAKQNLIGHDGEATGRDPQQFTPDCQCDPFTFDRRGRGDCNSRHNGREWCYLLPTSFCFDQQNSRQLFGRFWSWEACTNFNTFGVALMDAPPPSG